MNNHTLKHWFDILRLVIIFLIMFPIAAVVYVLIQVWVLLAWFVVSLLMWEVQENPIKKANDGFGAMAERL